METDFPPQDATPEPVVEPAAKPASEPAPVHAAEAEFHVAEPPSEATAEAAAVSTPYSSQAAEAVPSGPAAWSERRAARRFAMQLPVFVTVGEGGIKDHPTVTRDVSASGVFFEMETPLPLGTEVEFTLTLPREITHSEAIRVHCLGTVVRCESGERTGVAAVIDEFDLLA